MNDNTRPDNCKRIAFLYPYFFPGYKAGGITQSLYNLSEFLSKSYRIRLICLDHDFRDSTIYDVVTDNRLHQLNEQAEVHYIEDKLSLQAIYHSLKQFDPDFVYVAGIFNFRWLFWGTVYAIRYGKKIVVSPRGMLHGGGLQKGRLKKNIYLWLLRLFLSLRKTVWHATDDREQADIRHWFGRKRKNILVLKAMVVPRPLPDMSVLSQKKPGELKLVYYSLITSKKNLLLLLEAMEQLDVPASLTVYGPAVEPSYMTECESAVRRLGSHITVVFKGEVPYSQFASEAHQHQFFVLPTKGENFGHAIFEALALGLPVIISRFTPWQFEEGKAGYYTELEVKTIAALLKKLYYIGKEEYNDMSASALAFAEEYYNRTLVKCGKEYGEIFSEK